MILVTGASGKTGRAVIAGLMARGAAVRAMVRSSKSADDMAALGVPDIAVAEMENADAFTRVAQGVSAIYHICPNVSAHEIAAGRNAIDAAIKAGVGRLVFHSVLHPQIEAMPHHWAKMRVEEMLFASGLEWTVLQPTAYMQNLVAVWDEIAQGGIYRVAWSVTAPISLVDLDDVGEAAAKVVLEPDHHGAVYELCGTPPLSAQEVAAALSQALGKPVQAVSEPVEAWHARARAGGMDAHAADTLARMSRYYDEFGLVGNPNVLRWLLGRAPNDLAAFAMRMTDNTKE